ncbi:MAG: hypothetical protein M0R33_17175 [Methylomonas sp.]|jgi:hypothetical protein|uniref:hypothetical protein n=1 Tax=Methylomonas sp. TaxID=418 RepID=UPI0025FCAEAA|nr:hypothetical protein [Methylomonas sp.]MCK9608179.1 hypothetical protein [Methylomonas sp.]
MANIAAENGQIELCVLAKNWSTYKTSETTLSTVDPNDILRFAAAGGHKTLCEIAKNWGATDFNRALKFATRKGQKDTCVLMKNFGATDFDGMLRKAARHGNRELCILAREWGATDFAGMLAHAENGKEEDCASPSGYLGVFLLMAPRKRHSEICDLADKWIAESQ